MGCAERADSLKHRQLAPSVLVVLILVAVQGCSSAVPQKTEHRFYVQGEAVLDFAPEGWKSAGDRSGEQLRNPNSFFLPGAQDRESWKEMITISQPRLSGDPSETVDTMLNAFKESCEGYKVVQIDQSVQNNYSTVTKLMFCGKSRRSPVGKGGVGIVKAFSTNSGPVVLLRQLRLDPYDVQNLPLSSQKSTELLEWAKGVYMC